MYTNMQVKHNLWKQAYSDLHLQQIINMISMRLKFYVIRNWQQENVKDGMAGLQSLFQNLNTEFKSDLELKGITFGHPWVRVRSIIKIHLRPK